MINVVENIYIDADDSNFIIVIWDGEKNEKGTLVNARRRYYSSFESMMDGLVRILLRKEIYMEKVRTINELAVAVGEIRKFIVDTLKDVRVEKTGVV